MEKQKRIHFIGCMGVSMQKLLSIAKGRGDIVTGSDALLNGHDKNNIHKELDLVVFSAAIGDDNEELARAKELGIRLMTRGEFLGEVMSGFDTSIGIGGAHGKTTTTAMMASVLKGLDPCVHIGVDEPPPSNDEKNPLPPKIFITEACEYKKSFLHLSPDIAIVLNMDLDHTDCYQNIEEAHLAFCEFANRAKKLAIVGDGCQCTGHSAKAKRIIKVGLKKSCDIRAGLLRYDEEGCYSYCLFIDKKWRGRIRLNIKGKHNVLNSLFVIAAALELGLSLEEIKKGLAEFKGIGRRLEKIGELRGSAIYSDYAHHPSEIDCTIASMRECKYEKLVICFEPHTYTRTASFYKEFALSLSKADKVILLPIFAAREQKIEGIESQLIEKELKKLGHMPICIDDYMSVCQYLNTYPLDSGSAIVFMGAGTIDGAARDFVGCSI